LASPRKSSRRLSAHPFALVDIKSWLFFGIGFVWSIAALSDGIFYTDRYPGYASLEKRVQRAHQNYIDRKNALVTELQSIRDDAIEQMQEVQTDLGKRRAEHESILVGRAS